ncbi:hypothetical protein [Dyella subtropica]|uniref:hypothetical protein n=1 Tax=Dyella subtropica TaxID=2992127 RepID=UPI00225C1542|nr:hypothetical protein [Dyella subtropica]
MDIHIDIRRTLSPAEFGPEALLAKYTGTIYRSLPHRVVGRARAYVVPIEQARDHGHQALDFLDVDGDVWPYHVLLSRREAGAFSAAVNRILGTDEVFNQNLLIIDRVDILPRYRGHDYGLQAMHLMLTHLSLGCRLAAIKPYPLQLEVPGAMGVDRSWHQRLQLERFTLTPSQAMRKLRSHYACLGFAPVPSTDFMVRDLEDGYLMNWDNIASAQRDGVQEID